VADELVTYVVDHEAAAARIMINRPAQQNRLTSAMGAQLTGFLDQVEADDDVKVVVITGTGPNLSAGWDPEDAWDQYVEAPGGAVKKHPSQRV
jgi:enoyl-CoA hydratase/carnithine racemase